ncbi:hypothetical protein KQX54_000618, partial [Cotesia glomerata]
MQGVDEYEVFYASPSTDFGYLWFQEEDIKFIDAVLGHGAFGAVILATWNNTEVTVKKNQSLRNNQ